MSETLKILPLGGLGEIGMNCLVLEWGDHIVLIDCGLQFPDASYAGVDLLTPDLSYVRSKLDRLRGIIVTHGHDDHIGAIPFLARDTELDVYCTAFPKGLIWNKLSEFADAHEIHFHDITPRQTFRVGPFVFDPIPVAHSIIEALAFVIHTPLGYVIHSGDFKHDAHELGGQRLGFEPFAEYGDQGVLLLMSDSTNAERAGHTLSETDISSSFERFLSQQTGRLLIALFASNIRRVENLLWIAHRLGKKVAFAGRSMHSYTKLAHEISQLNIPADTLVLLENTQHIPDENMIVLLTGSQAEPRSALVRIAEGVNKDFQIKSGDKVILSSRFIPGNERNIASMIDNLYRQGAEVIYESIHQIHVSGHGFQEELLMMLRAVRPRYFVPIHGEYRHLAKHAKLAKESGVAPDNVFIIEDGQTLEVSGSAAKLGEKLDVQKGVIVEGSYMEGNRAFFSQRLSLAKTGIVFAVLMRDAQTQRLVTHPAVSGFGLLYRKEVDATDTLYQAEDYLEDLYYEAGRRDDLEDLIRLELRRFFRKRVNYKPVVIPLVLDV